MPHRCCQRMPSRTARALVSVGLGMLACLARGDVEDELVRVQVEAGAPGGGVAARDQAVRNAHTTVLVQVLDAIVGDRGWAETVSLLEHPDRYIQTTRILAQDYRDGATNVEIETFVRRKLLRTDAGKRLRRALPFPPKVLVAVAERLGPDAPAVVRQAGPAHSSLVETLRKARMDVIEPGGLLTRYGADGLLERMAGDLSAVRRLARESHADVAVLGDALVETDHPEGSDVYAGRATVTLRIVRSRDGQVLEVLTAEAVVHSAQPDEGAQQAIEDACAKLREDLVVAIVLGVFTTGPEEGAVITVRRIGARDRWDRVMAVLTDFVASDAIEELYYADEEARLCLAYDGPMAPLVDRLTFHDFPGFCLEADRVVGRDAVLTARPLPGD